MFGVFQFEQYGAIWEADWGSWVPYFRHRIGSLVLLSAGTQLPHCLLPLQGNADQEPALAQSHVPTFLVAKLMRMWTLLGHQRSSASDSWVLEVSRGFDLLFFQGVRGFWSFLRVSQTRKYHSLDASSLPPLQFVTDACNRGTKALI
jgi:hypothetical protein